MSKNKHKNHECCGCNECINETTTNINKEAENVECENSNECSKECSASCECNEDTSKIDALNDYIKELEERVLREKAELVNYRRRKDEEVSGIIKYSNEELIKEMLPIVDNFERAIKLDDNDLSDELSKFLSGFKMIYTSIIEILNKYEVKEIEAEGIEFNPKIHQAVLMEHDSTLPSGVVLEVLQKGYMYKDRVIRPSMVKVNE